MRCPSCGNDNPDEFPFCIECGARVEMGGPRQAQPDPRTSYDNGPQYDNRGGGYDPRPPTYEPPAPSYDPHPPPYEQRPPPNDQRQPAYDQRPPPYDDRRGYQEPTPAPAPRPAPTRRTARLILESGLGKQEYSLDAPVVTIGRSRSNDISLDDARVSRHHARIVRDDRGYLLEDLNSRNGTRVDDRAVRDSCVLEDGALLKIGDAVFRFVMRAPADLAPRGANPADPRVSTDPNPNRPSGSAGAAAPVVFLAPWSPIQCPQCQSQGTMRPIVYGQAANEPAAQDAARRGEVVLMAGQARPDGPNAECRNCSMRVRIVPTSS